MKKNKTKIKIVKSFFELLKEEDFNKITIQDISKRAEIERQTFYYHFKDLNEMMEWAIEYNIETVKKKGLTPYSNIKSFVETLREIREDETLLIAYKKAPRDYGLRLTSSLVNDVIDSSVKYHCEGKEISDSNYEFVSLFYKSAMLGVVNEWIANDMKKEPEFIAKNLYNIIHNTIDITIKEINRG